MPHNVHNQNEELKAVQGLSLHSHRLRTYVKCSGCFPEASPQGVMNISFSWSAGPVSHSYYSIKLL